MALRIWRQSATISRAGLSVGRQPTAVIAFRRVNPTAAWRTHASTDSVTYGMSAWTAQWVGSRPELATLVSMGRQLARRLRADR